MSKGEIIKAVKLDLDGKEVDLTMEQAKKLHVALNELFGEKDAMREAGKPYDFVWNRRVMPFPDETIPIPVNPMPGYVTCTSDGTGNELFSTTTGVVATFDPQSDSGTLTLKVA